MNLLLTIALIPHRFFPVPVPSSLILDLISIGHGTDWTIDSAILYTFYCPLYHEFVHWRLVTLTIIIPLVATVEIFLVQCFGDRLRI
jgi:hypothetical protein